MTVIRTKISKSEYKRIVKQLSKDKNFESHKSELYEHYFFFSKISLFTIAVYEYDGKYYMDILTFT